MNVASQRNQELLESYFIFNGEQEKESIIHVRLG